MTATAAQVQTAEKAPSPTVESTISDAAEIAALTVALLPAGADDPIYADTIASVRKQCVSFFLHPEEFGALLERAQSTNDDVLARSLLHLAFECRYSPDFLADWVAAYPDRAALATRLWELVNPLPLDTGADA